MWVSGAGYCLEHATVLRPVDWVPLSSRCWSAERRLLKTVPYPVWHGAAYEETAAELASTPMLLSSRCGLELKVRGAGAVATPAQ